MGETNLGYFTLDEDSDVEEYVVDDPNFRKKAFWYDLVEKTIGSTSRNDLLIHALSSAFGLFLQWKLLITFMSLGSWGYFGWTIMVAALAGATNLVAAFSRRNKEADTTVQFQRLSLRVKYFVLILRQVTSFCLLARVYNLFYYWAETSKNEKDLRRPLVMRSQPQPTKQEIVAVQKVWEGALERSYSQLIEAFLKFLPFALLQICILVHHTDSTEEYSGKETIAYMIYWSTFEISWASTTYANAQFHYGKSLQFQDMRETGGQMNLLRISRLDSAFYLLNNLASAAFRLYCIALLLATINFWVVPFILVIYLCFNGMVKWMPNRARLRLENPPKGLSSFVSDLISRWINFFTSINIKQECFIHFTYLFTLVYFIPRIWYVASEWTNVAQDEFHQTEDFEEPENNYNYTRSELVQICLNETIPLSVPLPVYDSIIIFLSEVIIYITHNCSPQRHLLQDDLAVILLLALHYALSLIYLAKAKSRILSEFEFPAQIAQKYWVIWLNKEWDFNDIFELKKILLCMMMTDQDLSALANRTTCRWTWWRRNKITREALLALLWEKYVGETNILTVNQERLKLMMERRKKLRNNSQCDETLNRFLEFLWDNFVLEEDTVRMVLFAMEHFDESVVNSNSLRLTHIQEVLNFKESIWK